MEPENLANLIAGGALLVSVLAIVRGETTRRSGAEQAAKADAAAEKSAEAAGRSAAALERMAEQWAESLSRAERRDQRQWSGRGGDGPDRLTVRGGGPWAGPSAGVEAPVPLVHWTVDRVKGGKHLLTNLGRAPAYDVKLRSDNAVRFDGPPKARTVKVGEAVDFFVVGSMQTGTPELVVSWRDAPDGESSEWRRPLP